MHWIHWLNHLQCFPKKHLARSLVSPSSPTTTITASNTNNKELFIFCKIFIVKFVDCWIEKDENHWNQLFSLSQNFTALTEAGATYVCFPKQLFIELAPLARPPAHVCQADLASVAKENERNRKRGNQTRALKCCESFSESIIF